MTLEPLELPTTPSDCPVCTLAGQRSGPVRTRTYDYECDRCGRFKLTYGAGHALRELSEERRPRIAGWIARQNRIGVVPLIAEADISSIAVRPRLKFAEMARQAIEAMTVLSTRPGVAPGVTHEKFQAIVESFDQADANAVYDYLLEERLAMLDKARNGALALTAKGLIQGQEWVDAEVASTQGFVAMWFSNEVSSAWHDGFIPGISEAGYRPHRVDMGEHVNKICDQIVAEIRRSRFVVADFTGNRGGVYFEAGYALGRGLPVIWTCRKDHFSHLHFDIRQYNCIDWECPSDLRERLRRRIEAVIGPGPSQRLP